MKRLLFIAIILIVSMLAFTACRNDDNGGGTTQVAPPPPPAPPTPPPAAPTDDSNGDNGEVYAGPWTPNDMGPATIRMAWWGGQSRHDAVNAALNLFMDRYPHITVVPEYGAFDGYLDSLIVMLADGSEPDVFQSNYAWVHMLDGGNNPYMNLRDWNHIIDLGEWSDALLARTTTADGQLAGVPHGITGRVIIYCTDMLAEHGLSTFPATFDEWIALGEAVTANNTDLDTPGNQYAFWPIGAPGNDLSMDIIIMTMIINHFGVNLEANGRILPTIDQVEYVFNIVGNMMEAGLLPTHQQQEGVTNVFNPVWMEGRGGSVFEWVGNIHLAGGAFMDNDADEGRIEGLGVALLPAVVPGGTRLSMQRPSIVHAVGRSTNHPELAVYLLNWLYTDEEALALIFDQFGIPLSHTADRLFQQQGGAWGLMLDGFGLLEANEAIMCAYFEDGRLRPHRLHAIENFRNGSIDAREAARQWVEYQQYGLNN
ncbi:MAG: ABC transporter substrate-binding protein [Firmicutes bacterium]|nr:ABC transporter substrate-binding protein [Bacillota bacterium]